MTTYSETPAFPTPEFYDEKPIGTIYGLTKREHISSLALQGLLANPNVDMEPQSLAEEAVRYADELLKQLAK